MEVKKRLPLPILIIIIGAVLGMIIAIIGIFRQINAKKVNEERYNEAYQQIVENVEILKKRYDEITIELNELNTKYTEKQQECNNIPMMSDGWFEKQSKCQSEASNLRSQITDLETEQFKIENYDNTVYYNMIGPMYYQIFYIVGASVFGVALLGAFIIYLVKGKKTYN